MVGLDQADPRDPERSESIRSPSGGFQGLNDADRTGRDSTFNEFYSEHYLQTVFEGDVQELRARWRAEEKAGGNPADRRLEKAGARWRKLVSDYKAERNDRKRLLIFREFARELLGALGYERDFRLISDAEEKLLPVSALRADAAGRDRVWVVETVAPRDADFETGPSNSVSAVSSSNGSTKRPTSKIDKRARRRPPSTRASSPCANRRAS